MLSGERVERLARPAHQFSSGRVGRRLGDHPHDGLGPGRTHVNPPVVPREPEAILRVGVGVGERRAQCLVHRSERSGRPVELVLHDDVLRQLGDDVRQRAILLVQQL